MANKVEFGISNLYVGTYSVNTAGTVTLGTPYHQAGAVSFSPEEQSDENNFYADNIVYWAGYSGGTFEGDLEVAKFDDTFKTQFLGYTAIANGGIAIRKNVTKPALYVMFQVEGDAEKRRIIMYNVASGVITREYATTEDTIEPATETLNLRVLGDNGTGISMVSYNETTSGFSTLFTSPPVPALP